MENVCKFARGEEDGNFCGFLFCIQIAFGVRIRLYINTIQINIYFGIYPRTPCLISSGGCFSAKMFNVCWVLWVVKWVICLKQGLIIEYDGVELCYCV